MSDVIKRDGIFIKEVEHLSNNECQYCGISFKHLHKVGSKNGEFTKLPEETWEDKYDRKFLKSTILFEEYQKEGVLVLLNDIKDFIRREFI